MTVALVLSTTYAVANICLKKNSGLNGIQTHDLCDAGASFSSQLHIHSFTYTVKFR